MLDRKCRKALGFAELGKNWSFFVAEFVTKIHKVLAIPAIHWHFMQDILPICSLLWSRLDCRSQCSLLASCLGRARNSGVKAMPYESGMDPIHDTRRRFDIHFHLVAIAFLLFDVELLFLYPWAVARPESRRYPGGDHCRRGRRARGWCFGEVMFFVALLAVGFVYAWRKGVFRWR